MAQIKLSTVDLHYRIEGRGPVVLFLHGAGGSSLSWFQQIPVFAREFTCVAIDHPGFGASRWLGEPTGTVAVLAEWVERMNWGRVCVVAHSLGGWAALRLAIEKPHWVAALVLASSWAGLQIPGVLRVLAEREPALRAEQERWRSGDPGAWMPGLGQRLLEEQPALHWLAAGISALNRDAGRRAWQKRAGKYDSLLVPETEPDALRGWSIPSLCLCGDEDIVVPPAAVRLVAEALGAEHHVLERTGHSVFLQRADAFNALALDFLRRS